MQTCYNLAGLTGSDLSLSPEARATCNANGWTTANGMDCEDDSVHGLRGMQHFNADQSTCGYGCSGNPYDAWVSRAVARCLAHRATLLCRPFYAALRL